jgi:hypothetical protein
VFLDSSSLMLNINPVDSKSIKGKLANWAYPKDQVTKKRDSN